jgi:hypothetical protein
MHDTPDAFAGYSVFFIGPIPDSLISALDSWGLVVTSGVSVSTATDFDLVIQSDEAPIVNAEAFYTFLSENLPDQPAIKTDQNALGLLYGEMPEMISEVNILAKISLDEDLPILDAAISSDVAAIILHKMKSCLALTGYIGLQSEIVAWEKIWKYGKGVSHRFPDWKSHKDALYERILYVSHNI